MLQFDLLLPYLAANYALLYVCLLANVAALEKKRKAKQIIVHSTLIPYAGLGVYCLYRHFQLLYNYNEPKSRGARSFGSAAVFIALCSANGTAVKQSNGQQQNFYTLQYK